MFTQFAPLPHFTPSQFACSRQSLLHVPEVQTPVQVVESRQSKLQSELAQDAEHFALSSHEMLHVPLGHAMAHSLDLSQFIEQKPVVHANSHFWLSVHVHWSPQSFLIVPLSAPPEEDAAPSVTGVPLEPPLLLVDPELDDEPGDSLPIVQS